MFVWDVLADAFVDTLKLLPFLFVTYLIMEILENRVKERSVGKIRNSNLWGPLWGGALGVIPQCEFSASASSLYSSGLISVGTLISIFLSTSDEMLPIFISEQVGVGTILAVLLGKVFIGVVTGFIIDRLIVRQGRRKQIQEYHKLVKGNGCSCGCNFIPNAITYTLKVAFFVFVVTFGLGIMLELVGEQAIGEFISGFPVVGVLLAAVVGLIPSCGASVVLAELYLQGILGVGQMMAGLLVGAGVGLLVLFRSNGHFRENIQITIMLYICGVVWGLIILGLSSLF